MFTTSASASVPGEYIGSMRAEESGIYREYPFSVSRHRRGWADFTEALLPPLAPSCSRTVIQSAFLPILERAIVR